MKLAIVTATFPPYRGGTGNVAYHHARLMHERGHQVTVFTAAYHQGGGPTFPFRVDYLKPVFRMGNAPFTPDLSGKLAGFDVIHLHYPYIFGAELTCWAARRRHQPVVITYHNDLIAAKLRGWLFKEYTKWLQPRILRSAALIMATSADYAEHSFLKNVPGIEVRSVPNGVDVDRFVPGQGMRPKGVPSGSPWALFVGALDKAHFFKGLQVLMQAVQSLADWHLVVVGDGELRPWYVEQAESIGVGDRIHWMGPVEEQGLVGLYQGATVTVLPSTTTGEAFGLVLAESMACGTPVIASDLPGVRSVVPVKEGMGWLAAAGDVADLARVLRGVQQGGKALAGPSVRRWATERYNWQKVGAGLEEIYRSVTKNAAQSLESAPSLHEVGDVR